MRISDWSSDVCSSDLIDFAPEAVERRPLATVEIIVRTIADPVHHRAGQRAAADMDVVRAGVVAPFGAVAHRSRLGDQGVRARIHPDGLPYAKSLHAILPTEQTLKTLVKDRTRAVRVKPRIHRLE